MGNKTKVAAALSGGVDSAVAAYLLSRQGLAVEGVHLHLEGVSAPSPDLPALAGRLGIDGLVTLAVEGIRGSAGGRGRSGAFDVGWQRHPA